MKIFEEIETENYGKVPILDIRMMTNEEELAWIAEDKKQHPERYTPEKLAEARAFAESPCNIPGLREVETC